MILRASQAIEYLLGAIQEGYYQVMIGSHGASGSVGALQTQLKIAESFIEALIGFGKSGDYLKFTEYGVQPASGARYQSYSTIAPASVFADWIKRARLNVPDRFKSASHRMRDRVRALRRLSRSGGTAAKGFSRIAIQSALTRRQKTITGDLDAKARLRWAWAMVIKRKRFGYRGLHIIERIAKQEEANIRAILEGL